MRLVLIAFLLAGAARAEDAPLFRWEQPKAHEVIALGAASTLIWLDVLQTLDWNRKGQPGEESNPFLGEHPSKAKILLVGGVFPSLLLAGIWYALPSNWRILPCGAVFGGELNAVLMNSAHGLAIRF